MTAASHKIGPDRARRAAGLRRVAVWLDPFEFGELAELAELDEGPGAFARALRTAIGDSYALRVRPGLAFTRLGAGRR